MKRVALYCRVSTPDQHIETQLLDLRRAAEQRGFVVAGVYSDVGISGAKARRPGLDAMLLDARRRKFSIVMCVAFDRIARSTKHFLQVMDELDDLGIEFISLRENIDTSGAMGRFFMVLTSALAEIERSICIERVRASLRRRKLEGLPLGRQPLDVDHAALVRDRLSGMSLTNVARKYGVSRASVVRFTREAQRSIAVEVDTYHGSPVLEAETSLVA